MTDLPTGGVGDLGDRLGEAQYPAGAQVSGFLPVEPRLTDLDPTRSARPCSCSRRTIRRPVCPCLRGSRSGRWWMAGFALRYSARFEASREHRDDPLLKPPKTCPIVSTDG
jgi:hypothetical protein